MMDNYLIKMFHQVLENFTQLPNLVWMWSLFCSWHKLCRKRSLWFSDNLLSWEWVSGYSCVCLNLEFFFIPDLWIVGLPIAAVSPWFLHQCHTFTKIQISLICISKLQSSHLMSTDFCLWNTIFRLQKNHPNKTCNAPLPCSCFFNVWVEIERVENFWEAF